MPILNINEDGHLISCVPEGPDDNGSVVLSSEVKSIAPDAFDTYRNDIVEIWGDTSAELPKGFLRNSSKLQRVNLPNVLKMGDNCFSCCIALASVELSALTTMGNLCFSGCSALGSVGLPALTTMGVKCFNGCNLDILEIFIWPSNVNEIKTVLPHELHDCIRTISKERCAFLFCWQKTPATEPAATIEETTLRDTRLIQRTDSGRLTSPYGGMVTRFL